MTQEEKAKAYDEALKWMRELYPGLHGATKEDAEHYFPELRESEDKTMFNRVIESLVCFRGKVMSEGDESLAKLVDKEIQWMLKCKESLHISESCKENADSFTSEDERIRKELVAFFIEVRNRERNDDSYWHDLKVADILSFLEKQKEQQPAEKQDYSGLTDLERAIHRGFLVAGVENVPVKIIKETAQECLAQMKPAEWSEEDELNTCPHYSDGYGCDISPMKKCESCEHRPSWKPTEEQMKALRNVAYKNGNSSLSPYSISNKVLASLYEQLKKLGVKEEPEYYQHFDPDC